MPEWTIQKILRWTADYFSSHRIDSPRLTAEILLAHVLGLRRIDLYLRFDQPLVKSELAAFKSLVQRRIRREPVAYITGEKAFWSLDLQVTPDVLIPRPDTECLVEAALRIIPPAAGTGTAVSPRRILDMGTGSGAIILALVRERPGHLYFASDISFPSLVVARNNARRLGLESRVHFLAADWLTACAVGNLSLDMIVCNPPYIPTAEIDSLQPEIRCYEPRLALDGTRDGLAAYRKILDQAVPLMAPTGTILLEIGSNQKEAVLKLCREYPEYRQAHILPDVSGHDRVLRVDMESGFPLSG